MDIVLHSDPQDEIAVMTLDQDRTKLVWHPGTLVPGGIGWPDASFITAPELPRLLAAFNVGFTFTASRGGTRDGDHTNGTLRGRAASLLIDTTGRADVRAYDARRDRHAVVVRQNLDLPVDDAVPASSIDQDDSLVWGKPLHHRHATSRTAVGVIARMALIVVVASRATTA